MADKKAYCIVIEHDLDPDFSWLEQDCYNPRSPEYDPVYPTKEDCDAKVNAYDGDWYRDPENHVALSMVACDEDGEIIDSLGGIDFLADSDDWKIGTVYRLATLDSCPYLRE